MSGTHHTLKLYTTVIDDVIHSVSDSFLDEGVDEQVLQELKQMWTTKMLASKAIEQEPPRPNLPPPNVVKSGVLNKGANKTSQANGTKSKAQQQRTAASAASQDSHNTTNGTTAPSAASQSTGGGAAGTQSAAAAAPSGASSAGAAAASGNAASSATNQLPALDPFKLIPIQITLPPQGDSEARMLTIHLPASAIQNNQLGQMLTASVITSIMNLPPALASSVLQQHVNTTLQNNALQNTLSAQRQLDGAQETSDEDGSELSDADVDNDEDDDKDEEEDEDQETGGAEEEPLNSEDDVTDEDAADLFETDNVIVCQYDKITRSRNKWKFHLKDGIMNIGGKDYVFSRSNGDAEW